MPNLPNFIVIGAAKSGTTVLFHFLTQHPQIFGSKPKEPNYFCLAGEKLDFVEPNGEPGLINKSRCTTLEAYSELFAGVRDEIAVGEASVAYMPDPKVPKRIRDLIPDVKLIAILRNPADAAFSGYLMTCGHGVEPCKTFEEALADQDRRENERCFDGLYVQPGFYHAHLQRYRALFPDEQIRVYLYDDFCEDPLAVLKDIFGYLEVDQSYIPDLSDQINRSGVPKSMFLHRMLTPRTNPFLRLIGPLLPMTLRQPLRLGLMAIRNRNLDRATMTPDTRRKLIELFRDDIERLQDLLQRDLSHWLH